MLVPSDLGFPSQKFPTFRSYPGFSQWDTARELAISDRRVSLLDAPPGAGKSAIYLAAGKIMGANRTLILTPSKALQSQLMSDFEYSDFMLFSIQGHGSYPCTSRAKRSTNNDEDDFTDLECDEGRESCPYWADVDVLNNRDFVVTNYANWVSIAAKSDDPTRFGSFDLLICDEAHNLESLLCSLLAVKFSKRATHELIEMSLPAGSSPISTWVEWAREALTISKTRLAESRKLDRLSGSSREGVITRKLTRLISNLLTIASITDEWVSQPTDSGYILTPAFAERYVESHLFRSIPRIILSSATLTPQDAYFLGLTADDFDYTDVESGFPAERRPFIYSPVCEIDYRTMKHEGIRRQVVNRIDRIIDSRLDRKGIIHSISYDYRDMVHELSRHEIRTHPRYNAKRYIAEFMDDPEPGILASPLLAEGLDFAHGKARYQIILKVPSQYSKEPLIAVRRKRYGPKYTNYLAAKTILQMSGRLCRSMTDWGETFMIDKHWGNWFRDSVQWPKYFERAWVNSRDVPNPINF